MQMSLILQLLITTYHVVGEAREQGHTLAYPSHMKIHAMS